MAALVKKEKNWNMKSLEHLFYASKIPKQNNLNYFIASLKKIAQANLISIGLFWMKNYEQQKLFIIPLTVTSIFHDRCLQNIMLKKKDYQDWLYTHIQLVFILC